MSKILASACRADSIDIEVMNVKPKAIADTVMEVGVVLSYITCDTAYVSVWGLLRDSRTLLPYALLGLYERYSHMKGPEEIARLVEDCVLTTDANCSVSIGSLMALTESEAPPAVVKPMPAYDDMRRLVLELAKAGFAAEGVSPRSVYFSCSYDEYNDDICVHSEAFSPPGRFVHQSPWYTLRLEGDFFGITEQPIVGISFNFRSLPGRLRGKLSKDTDIFLEDAIAGAVQEAVRDRLARWEVRRAPWCSGYEVCYELRVPEYDGNYYEVAKRFVAVAGAAKQAAEDVVSALANSRRQARMS